MRFLLLLTLFICTTAIAQDSIFLHLPIIDGKVNYTRIFDVDSTNKNTLFLRIKDWAVDAYRSQKDVLQSEDKEAGYIAFKGILPIQLRYHGGILNGQLYNVDVYHTLIFYIKDGKVKMVFADLEVSAMDAASIWVDRPERMPIEKLDYSFQKMNAKRRAREMNNLQIDAKRMNRQFVEFVNATQKKISQSNSAFDF